MSMAWASPRHLGELYVVCLLLPLLGWSLGEAHCGPITSFSGEGGSGWGSCTSSGGPGWPVCLRTPSGRAWGKVLRGQRGAHSAASQAAQALSNFLERSSFLGSSGGQLALLGGWGEGGITNLFSGREERTFAGEAAFLGPFVGNSRSVAKLTSAPDCYSAPQPFPSAAE